MAKDQDTDHARAGRELRDLVLSCRIRANPYHDCPGWEELTDYSRATWTRVAMALIQAGWLPPGREDG